MRFWTYAVLAVALVVYGGVALHFLLDGDGWLALIVWLVLLGLAVQFGEWLVDRVARFGHPRELDN